METKSAKRFGDVATGLGFVTSSELDEALAVQIKEDIEQGSHRPIGQILFDLGHINAQEVRSILKELAKKS